MAGEAGGQRPVVRETLEQRGLRAASDAGLWGLAQAHPAAAAPELSRFSRHRVIESCPHRGAPGAGVERLPSALLESRLPRCSQEVKSSSDFSSCFLDFYQDGLRRLSGNEYVLSTKSKF